MSILAIAALGAILAIGPTTPSMAQVANAQSRMGDASMIYVREGGGGGGYGGGGHGDGYCYPAYYYSYNPYSCE